MSSTSTATVHVPPRTVFQLFTKAPEPGFCKTRLIPALGAERSARLQEAFIHQGLRACSEVAARVGGAVELWCAPDHTHPFFRACAQRFELSLHRQRGVDLGARMCAALAEGLRRAPGAVLLGTDAPTLTASHLVSAASALADGRDAVIAPAHDGGYVLIGLTRVEPGLFEGVRWGSARVLHQTRRRLDHFGYRWLELPAHHDIDRPEDWARWLAVAPDWGERLGDR